MKIILSVIYLNNMSIFRNERISWVTCSTIACGCYANERGMYLFVPGNNYGMPCILIFLLICVAPHLGTDPQKSGQHLVCWAFYSVSGLAASFKRLLLKLKNIMRLRLHRATLVSPFVSIGVDSSFTSGVHVRTTTTCTPSATIKTSRRTVAVERTRKASHSFVCQQ